jgi:serine/threonine-protein kinase
LIGTVFGHYRVTQKLGQGGVGDVWKAIDLSLDREVALKVLRPELAAQPEVVARFRAEALALAKLNHPNIATIHGFHVEGAAPFMVMEYVHGQTLHALVRGFGRMDVQRAIPLFLQVLDGIQHAHEHGIVHRDLKASNVMLSQSGVVKVLDFGIARRVGSVHLTRGSHSLGTPTWMAPEQVRGEETDARTDVYALGLLLYWLVAARLPFEGETEFVVQRAHLEQEPPSPRSFAPDLPRPIEQAILRALAKERARRCPSVAQLRFELGEAFEPGVTRPLPILSRESASPQDVEDEITRLTSTGGRAAADPAPAVPPTRLLEGDGGAAAGAAAAPQREEPAPRARVARREALPFGAPLSTRRATARTRWLGWAAAALVAAFVLVGLHVAAARDVPDRASPLAPSPLESSVPKGPDPAKLESEATREHARPAAGGSAQTARNRVQPHASPERVDSRKASSTRSRSEDAWVIRRD